VGLVDHPWGDRTGWAEIKDRRMAEAGAQEAYGAARLAYELGRTVRQLREQRDWSQTALADSAGMTQSAVARFEAGGTVPSLPGPELWTPTSSCTSPRAPKSPDHQSMLPCGRGSAATPVHQPCLHVSAMSVADESRSPAT